MAGVHAYIDMLVRDSRRGGDLLEQLDADQECAHGRLPYDRTPECGCWGPAVSVRKHGRVGQGRRLTDQQVLAAHRRHMAGESIVSISESLWRKAGYVSARICGMSLGRAFKRLGLEVRPPETATRLALTKHGLTAKPGGRRDHDKYNEWQRRQRAAKPQCHAIRPDGERCPYRARDGHYLCGRHAKNAGSSAC